MRPHRFGRFTRCAQVRSMLVELFPDYGIVLISIGIMALRQRFLIIPYWNNYDPEGIHVRAIEILPLACRRLLEATLTTGIGSVWLSF